MSETTNKIREHEQKLTKLMIDELLGVDNVILYGPLSTDKQIGILLINILGKDPLEVAGILDEQYGIGVRPGLHCAPYAHETVGTGSMGGVRFSIGYFNTEEDIKAAILAVKEIADL